MRRFVGNACSWLTRRTWLAITGLLLLSLAGYLFYHVHHAPRLMLRPTGLDLGNGRPGEVLRGVFELQNTGGTPLEFQLYWQPSGFSSE